MILSLLSLVAIAVMLWLAAWGPLGGDLFAGEGICASCGLRGPVRGGPVGLARCARCRLTDGH